MRRWLIFIFAFALFGVSVFGGFVQDDRRVILSDPTLGRVSGLVEAWINPYHKGDPRSGAYRPLTSFSLVVDSLVFGGGAWGYRLMNVVYFGFVCVGVYELMKRILANERMAFWTSLLFAALPIHTEAVSNIVGRGELLAGGFLILAVILAFDKKWGWSLLVWVLALLSKESAAVWIVPITLMIIKAEKNREMVMGLMASLAIVMIWYFLVRLAILGNGIFADNASVVENPLKYVGIAQRMMAGIGLIAFGVGKTIFPWRLSYDYSLDQLKIHDLTTWWFGLGVLLIGLSVWLWRKNAKAANWGLAFLWLPLLVTGNVLKPIGTIFGERLWFVPSLGVVMVAGMIVAAMMKKGKGVTVLLGVILLVFAGRTVVRNLDWLSEERLFVHDAKYITGSVLAQNNAAAMYLKNKNTEGSLIFLERASTIFPEYPELMNNWGIYYWQKGDMKSAQEAFEKCLEVHVGNGLCSGNLRDLNMVIKQSKDAGR